ncbi:N-acyl homoserine lactonase family protein [Kaistia dalseonensis]|uniref:Glyoxylase-like metal-dependent hydrolase (Beta-lactamase superfamily II) n=1 Tax=Kaistia dalseonensis TaxID=410840 RepID=A0ABU0H7D6_9HYPH|nr:N-acyl homoserine lactonase family protein [Kaistia dalseonensis]MCX5495619.1 N-acyl homoserine lactonase family protein [Kaistia dalseonensis]MDQ0438212.1 glyoxylase-like metal-dependent hydrolase (beta-lactamase superfamily II) [Kaistia dalseonensis]
MEHDVIDPHYEVLALRYASTAPDRGRRENFLPGMDLHDGPMPLDYYVWAIRGAGRTIVVDTGFGREAAERRKRWLLHDPVDLLAAVGIVAADVTDVVLTHLHYDHAGGISSFPNALFHLQESEMSYATGRNMCHACLSAPFDAEDVMRTVGLLFAGRLRFHNGDAALYPGISLHWVGGHSGGLQAVRVATRRGPLVLASDAFHFTENRLRRAPFPIVFNVGDMLQGFLRCESLAEGREDLLIPGHDPDVLRRWPRALADHPDIVRLDLAPDA